MAHDPHAYAALLGAFPTALLTTRGGDGHLHCRPMAMRQRLRGEEVWFATSLASKKCAELEADPRCALAFFDAEDGTTMSVSGRGEVIRDRKLALTLWDPSWSRWFPGGPTQKGVGLVRVIPEHVERHDGRTGKVEVLFSVAATRAALAVPGAPRRKERASAAPRPRRERGASPARAPAREAKRSTAGARTGRRREAAPRPVRPRPRA